MLIQPVTVRPALQSPPPPAAAEQPTVGPAASWSGWARRALGSVLPTQHALTPPGAPAVLPSAPPPLMTQHVRAEARRVADGVLAPRSASFISESTRGPTQAVVLALHGYTAGVWQMEEQRHRLNDAGFDMLAMRMPGHGTMAHERIASDALPYAHEIGRYDVFAQEAIAMAQDWARRKNVPLIVFGFSLGGTTACRILSLDPQAADGLVVMAPLLGHTQIKFRLLHNVAWTLALTDWGSRRLRAMSFSWGPQEPSPHWPGHWTCSASQTYAAVEFARRVGLGGGQWQVPTLGMVSESDLRCDSAATANFLHARNPQARVLRIGAEARVAHAMLSPMENPDKRVREALGGELVTFVQGVVSRKHASQDKREKA